MIDAIIFRKVNDNGIKKSKNEIILRIINDEMNFIKIKYKLKKAGKK